MLFKMSDDQKATAAEPAVIISSQQAIDDETEAKKSRFTKKHALIAAIILLVTGLIVTGVLVGIKIYTDSNLEILKYTLQANGLSQNASVDGNSVMYHVKRDDGVEAWIVQDFDKGIQVTKQIADGKSACYVTALNRSIATDAASIPDTAPDTGRPGGGGLRGISTSWRRQLPGIRHKIERRVEKSLKTAAVVSLGYRIDKDIPSSSSSSVAVQTEVSQGPPVTSCVTSSAAALLAIPNCVITSTAIQCINEAPLELRPRIKNNVVGRLRSLGYGVDGEVLDKVAIADMSYRVLQPVIQYACNQNGQQQQHQDPNSELPFGSIWQQSL